MYLFIFAHSTIRGDCFPWEHLQRIAYQVDAPQAKQSSLQRESRHNWQPLQLVLPAALRKYSKAHQNCETKPLGEMLKKT
jgi:hypothetical protein